MFSESNELAIPPSRLKLVGTLLGALAFVALGVLMIVVQSRRDVFETLVGLLCVGFFGAVAVSVLKHLLFRGPAVVINSKGIVDNSSGVSVGFIAWDEIEEICEYRFQDQTFLGITLKDVNKVVARQPKWKRSVIRANLKLGAAPVNIPQSVLGVKVSDLVREIQDRFRGGGV
jgi:hypothetical protein